MSNRSAERRFNSSLPVLAFCSELRKIAFRPVSSISTADKKRHDLYMSGKRNPRDTLFGKPNKNETH